MGKEAMRKTIMISNRGPDFTTGDNQHFAMGGTKGLYPQIFEALCEKWICLATKNLDKGSVSSEYGDNLEVLFVKDSVYSEYYYQYVSEYLYPSLLGFTNRSIKSGRASFEKTISYLADKVTSLGSNNDYVICDYHLYSLPALLPENSHKIFFWFIPFLTIDKYSKDFKEILLGLNKADVLYVFDDVWAQNFINLFRHFCPEEILRVEVRSLLMGPDDFYEQDFAEDSNIINQVFGKDINGPKIASVSRMDFVKEIPLLIKGFEEYMDTSQNKSENLLIFAPHHRKDSVVYKGENDRITKLVKNSRYADKIFLTHKHFSSKELRTIYSKIDVFVCPSRFDAMPLTPLEFMMSCRSSSSVILSDSIGAYRLLQTLCYSFKSGSSKSLAKSIALSLNSKDENTHRNKLMKEVLSESTIQKAITKLKREVLSTK